MAASDFETLHAAIGEDEGTSVAELKRLVDAFVAERHWHGYHAPKNLAMALAIEAAELMEPFQWLGVDESRDLPANSNTAAAVADELADVVCYAMALANAMGIDISRSVAAKMAKNVRKYPPGSPDPTGG